MGEGRNRNNRRKQKPDGTDDVVLFQRGDSGVPCSQTVICCIDDTDDLSGETSTGYVAEAVAAKVASLGGYVRLGISRHQLLLAEGVPYTSHNSAMAFVASLPEGAAVHLRQAALNAISEYGAPTADPGLCVGVIPPLHSEGLEEQVAALERFGRRAKREVCTKAEAYGLAEKISWITLSEHGGTGDGIIGALAGAGLRLGGSDGRFRGQWNIASLLGVEEGSAIDVLTFKERLEPLVGGRVQVVDICSGNTPLPNSENIRVSTKAKPVLLYGSLVFGAEHPMDSCEEGRYWQFVKAQEGFPGVADTQSGLSDGCHRFVRDSDEEECLTVQDGVCESCLYRRWTAEGFVCKA